MLALAMVVSGLYIITPDAGEVKAASTTQSQSNTIEPDVVADGMLNVKMQIQTNQGSEKYADGSVNLRLVSSVNGLGYRNVGFEVCLDINDDGEFDTSSESSEFIKHTTGSVSKRIDATVTGVTYNYSPKVVDTDAEYFVTGTLMGINQNHLSKAMCVRAFCTTMDGTVEYGTARYFNIKDATANNIINIPVKMDAAPATDASGNITDTVKIDGVDTTATLEKYDDAGYAHVNVTVASGDKTTLDSATKVEVGTESAVYRNLDSVYAGDGVGDISWYEEYLVENPNEIKFVIATAADLYGLSTLGKTNTFAGKTIYVVKDIDANIGRAAEEGWLATAEDGTEIKGATSHTWTPIGTNTNSFVGTFDGQDHTISGVYFNKTSAVNAWGLFGATGDCTVQNLTLANSYMKIDATSQVQLGSIAGKSIGTFDTVKVANDVYVEHTSTHGSPSTGGIVGYITGTSGEMTFSNCWFDGQLTAAGNLGGILGNVSSASDVSLKSCLYSGTIILNKGTGCIGGLCGNVYKSVLTLDDSLSVGTVDKDTYSVSVPTTSGAVFGYISGLYDSNQTYAATLNNTYAIVSNTWAKYAQTSSSGKLNVDGTPLGGGVTSNAISTDAANIGRFVEKNNCIGLSGYLKLELDFAIGEDYAGYWATTESGTPVLSSFMSKDEILALDEVTTPRTLWYDKAETNAAEYTLYSMADMFGFASLVDTVDFSNKTVKLGADITMNKGKASETGFTPEVDGTTLVEWIPVNITGIFDGDNNTIRGVYLDTDTGNAGLFGTVSGTVQNLRLQNSYFNCTDDEPKDYSRTAFLKATGSIAGSLSGTLDTVYSDAVVKHTYAYAGGLVGTVYGEGNPLIKNCCFAGQISANQAVGGIVGLVINTDVTMEHCLNAGKVTVTNLLGGGLCGYVRSNDGTIHQFNLIDSLNVGKITTDQTWCGAGFGRVVGAKATDTVAESWVEVTATSTYWHYEAANALKSWITFSNLNSYVTFTMTDALSTENSNTYHLRSEQELIDKTSLTLSFLPEGEESSSTDAYYWVAREGKIPMLESFEDLLTNVTY